MVFSNTISNYTYAYTTDRKCFDGIVAKETLWMGENYKNRVFPSAPVTQSEISR